MDNCTVNSFTFHILLQEDIENNGQPVVLGNVKELGSWKNPIVKLYQPFSKNPTYWRSDPVIISVSNFDRKSIQYKYAIHISKSDLLGNEEEIKFEFEEIDAQKNRVLDIEKNDQFDVWKMRGLTFIDYIYDSIEVHNLKYKVAEYQRLLSLYSDLVTRASILKFIIDRIDDKEKRLFLCILLGYYYTSKGEGLPHELPDKFPSSLLLNALEDYKQETLPLDYKDQMYTAITALVQHNAFQMRFEWLIIFTIATEVDSNYTFIDRLSDLKYPSENLLSKFIKEAEIIKPYIESIKFEIYIKLAKVNLKYFKNSLLKI
jgi:hypothetical protein